MSEVKSGVNSLETDRSYALDRVDMYLQLLKRRGIIDFAKQKMVLDTVASVLDGTARRTLDTMDEFLAVFLDFKYLDDLLLGLTEKVPLDRIDEAIVSFRKSARLALATFLYSWIARELKPQLSE